MSESEDRTQTPSKQRLQRARELGQVAHSPELTGASALIAAVALLGVFGDDLALALVSLLRGPFEGMPPLSADPGEVVALLRRQALAVAWPLGIIVAGASAAAVAVHQAQVGGLWVPGLALPDPERLWGLGRGPSLAARGARSLWAIVKTAVVLAAAIWSIREGWPASQAFAELEAPALASAVGHALRSLALTLASATLALGLVDFAMQRRRLEARLMMTPDEQREDMRSMEGDPALRARRRRLARSWRGDSAEILTGASLVLQGPRGLTLVLGGGPPPLRVSVRSALQGSSGMNLRVASEKAKIPSVDAPDLARKLAGRSAPALPIPPELMAELASIWPAAPER